MEAGCVGLTIQSSCGEVTLQWRGPKLRSVHLGTLRQSRGGAPRRPGTTGVRPDRQCLVDDFLAYFRGEKARVQADVDLSGYTDFQRSVWAGTRDIPYGSVKSYGWLAARIGRPKAARAVGAALGKNPVPIVVPCHRVVGADGSLTGFGCGLEWKRALLGLEGTVSADLFPPG